MTEMFVNMKNPKPPGPRYAVDPVAFFKALFLAPLIVAGAGFWALFIPVGALFFGYVPYLVFGTPILLIYLHYRSGDPADIAMLAVACVGALALVALALPFLATVFWGQPLRHIDGLPIFAILSIGHAFIWGAVFGKLYNRWRSKASRQPVPAFPNLPA